MKNTDDITGQTFGRLTAVAKVGMNNDNRAIWEWRCTCGNTHLCNIKDVRGGHSRSCGCLRREKLIKRNYRHGHTKHSNISTPEWKSWNSMITRLTKKSYHAYEHYKKRGITVCDRWLEFKNFYEDMGSRPAGTTIDRIDNDKGYYPGNCRWATHKQQMNNTSKHKYITFNGRTLNQSQWSDETGLGQNIICKRLKQGWSIERTLTTPLLSDWKIKDWRKQ